MACAHTGKPANAVIKMIRHLKIYSLLVATALFTGCRDELSLEEPVIPGQDVEFQGDCLVFSFEVDKNPDTRAGGESWNVSNDNINKNSVHPNAQEYDDWVDTQDKFRVFFFTKQGDFLFGAIDRTIAKGESGDINTQTYTVRIPMNVVVDRQGNEYPVEKLKDYLRHNNFKVAVLANWPNGGEKINPGDYDDGDNTGNFGDNPSSTLKGHPLWGYRNSVLYDPENDESDKLLKDKIGEKDVKNINDLHHLYADKEYNSTVTTPGRPIANQTIYSRFMGMNDDGEDAMGEPTDWVKMRNVEDGWHADYDMKFVYSFDSKETANQWIRANWNPEVNRNINKQIYRHYQHLWYLWNFDASYKYALYDREPGKYSTYASAYQYNFGWNDGFNQGPPANPWGKEWYERNGEKFYEWLDGSDSNHPLETKTILSGSGQNDSFFTFNAFANNERCYMVENPASALNGNMTYFGVRLPSRGTELAGMESPGTFVFQARTSGTLRVRWGNASDNNPATITIQKGTKVLNTYTIASGNRYKLYNLGGTSHSNETYLDISTDEASSPIYIYCSSGAAVIYAIEYIRGSYLYETDREGVIPSKDFPIPMYGVQEFLPLDQWEDGTTVTIPRQADKRFKLLRALAKVEVYIPLSFKRPRHMYMRYMNRAARCEPMDVENPIDWTEMESVTGSHPSDCEFFNVMNYGPTYDSAKGENASGYSDWLSWFYGSWTNAKWLPEDNSKRGLYNVDENGKWTPQSEHKGWDLSSNVPSEGNAGYPKIFNPYIDRSDFCHFIYMGEDIDGYHKYVLYVPEKYLDDPDSPGVFDSKPMVPHIEYRFDPATSVGDKENSLTHSEFNLDDDRCFRIYFTNYGDDNPGMGKHNPRIGETTGSSYTTYEKNRENLKYHWPIMRNHTYKFYVGGSAPDRITVNVVISDWIHEKVVTVW